jgi:hypothetical protein
LLNPANGQVQLSRSYLAQILGYYPYKPYRNLLTGFQYGLKSRFQLIFKIVLSVKREGKIPLTPGSGGESKPPLLVK